MNGNDGTSGTDVTPMPATNTTTLPGFVTARPRLGLTVAFGLLALGLLLLVVAVERDRLWWLVLWFVLGTVAVSISLLYANDRLAESLDHVDSVGDVPTSWWALFGSLTLAGLLGLGWFVVEQTGPVWATGCVLLIASGLIGVLVGVSRPPGPPPVGVGWWAAIGPLSKIGTGVMVASALWVGLMSGFGVLAWVLVVVWIGGLIALKIGVVPYLKSRRAEIRRTLLVLGVVAAVGFVLMALGARVFILLGLTMAIGALSVLGLAAVHCNCSARRSWWMIIGGGAAIVVGTVWVIVVVNGWQLGLVIAAFVWGIGTWYVFRGEGIVLVLLIGFIAVYGVVDRSADAEANPNPNGEVRMLALGDSFISGEGAGEFIGGTNVVGTGRPNECRRAATAYPYLVAAELGFSLDFVACQGAKMKELTRCGQMATKSAMEEFGFDDDELDTAGLKAGGYSKCTVEQEAWEPHRASLRDEPAGYLPQLANFAPDQLREFDVVVLSISGNDSGFSTIVKSCLLPQECSDEEKEWSAKVKSNRTQLRALYRQIRSSVGPDTPVIVMPYPRMVGGEACSLGLSSVEHEFIERFIDLLNGEIKGAAKDAGVNFFEYSLDSFDGNQLCDGEKGANHLRLELTEGHWAERYQPGKWIHGSMHPNELGHRRIADRLVPYVNELLADVDAGGSANPEGTDKDGAALTPEEQTLAVAAQGLLDDGSWITDDLTGTVRALILPFLLLLVAGIVFAAGLLRKDFWLSNALRPRDASSA